MNEKDVKPIRSEDIQNFNNHLMQFLIGNKLLPSTPSEHLEANEYKVFKEFLTDNKFKRKDLFPTSQWLKTLKLYLPEQLKYLADYVKLIDSPMKEVENYDKVLEEYYHNVKEIYTFALLFIKEKNKGVDFYEPVVINNVLKHIAIGLVSEVERYKYYKSRKEMKLNPLNTN